MIDTVRNRVKIIGQVIDRNEKKEYNFIERIRIGE